MGADPGDRGRTRRRTSWTGTTLRCRSLLFLGLPAAGQGGDGAADPDAEEERGRDKDADAFNDIDDKELETYLNTKEEVELKVCCP